jgi:hypothetical protein
MTKLCSWLAVVLSAGMSAGRAGAEGRAQLGPTVLRVPIEQRRVEQGILTPVPIHVQLPAALRAARVLVHYQVWGWPEWTTLELIPAGKDRWIGAIPCLEVSTITGDLVYYVRVHDAEGSVVGYSGSRHRPYRVTVIHDSVDPRQRQRVGRCPDPSDCPAGLAGCPSERVEKIPCNDDDDCEGDLTCGWDGYCVRENRALNALGVELAQGIGFVSTRGACSVEAQETEGFACYRERDGINYTGRPVYTNEPISAGWAQARVLIRYERLVYHGSTLGLRLGYAFHGSGPTLPEGTAFVPFSAELRASHWFGRNPFDKPAARAYVFMSAGYGMFDVQTRTRVREDVSRLSRQGGNDLEQTVELWKRAGDAHVGLGAGATTPVTETIDAALELHVLQAFPFSATIVQPSLGVRRAF